MSGLTGDYRVHMTAEIVASLEDGNELPGSKGPDDTHYQAGYLLSLLQLLLEAIYDHEVTS